MVELSEKLIRPSLGTLNGFVSASSGTARAQLAPSPLSNLAGSFSALARCVKRGGFAGEPIAFQGLMEAGRFTGF
jgi:hypothetical protein